MDGRVEVPEVAPFGLVRAFLLYISSGMRTYLLTLSILTSGLAFGQPYTSAKVLKSHQVLSQMTPELNLTGTILESENNFDGQKDGIGAGVRLDVGRGDLVFETGLLYRQMGGIAYLYSPEQARSLGYSDRKEAQIELNYIVTPIMAKYYFNGRGNSFFARIGIQPSILIFKEAQLRRENNAMAPDLSMVNDFDLVSAAGFGFQIQINETTLFVAEGTYLRGITPVFNNSSAYHHGFSGALGLGILL